MMQEIMGFWDVVALAGPYANNPNLAPESRQITTLTPHHSIFTLGVIGVVEYATK